MSQFLLRVTAGFGFLLLSMISSADIVYVCSHDATDTNRIITVVYDSEGIEVPCEVTYDKGEGVQTLWRAEAQLGYCEEKAQAFTEKQAGWGWSCVSDAGSADSVPSQEDSQPTEEAPATDAAG